MTTKRFLLAFWDGGGLVPPLLGMAKRLLARGHSVHVLSDPTVEAEALAAGCTFAPWRTAPHRTTRDRSGDLLHDYDFKSPLKYFDVAIREFFGVPGPRWVADILAEIERHPVDAVLCDALLPWPILAAEKLGLPSAALSPNVLLSPMPGVTPAGMGLMPARGPLGRLRDAALKAVMRRVFDKALPVLNHVRRDHGLEPLPSFFAQLSHADHVLVLTSAAFDFCSSSRPPNVSWVGPELDDPSWAADWRSPFSPEDTRPLVLVGLGSTFQNQVGVVRRIVAAFDGLEARGLVTLGPAIRVNEVTDGANAVVVPSAPHAVVLREASAFVTHAGHGAAIKGAAAGVPMLCIPLGRDQADNAVRVAHRGAGITLKPSASVDRIRAALCRLLTEPTYRDNARALAAAIRRREGDADAVSILESLARRADARDAVPIRDHSAVGGKRRIVGGVVEDA